MRIRKFVRTHWAFPTAVAVFAILTLILLNRSLLPSYTLIPLELIQNIAPWLHLDLGPRANRLIIDPFFIYYPNRFVLTEALRAGQFPLWNPYLFTGTPTLADPNFQPFYPPNLLAALFLDVEDALPWLAFFHLTLTGTFMYLFLRRQQLSFWAGVLGGSVWLLNGYGLVWLENPHRWSTAVWFPAIFWAYDTAVETRNPRWAVGGGLFLGLAILGGQVQFVFILGFLLGLYALAKLISQRRPWRWSAISYLFLIAFIGLSSGALLLWPAFEFSTYSHRTLFAGPSLAETSWPWTQLIGLIAPDFYGNPATPVAYWGAINFAEVTAYFSVVALLLALTAVVVARRTSFFWTSLLLALFVLLITLGTPIVQLLAYLPGAQFLALRRGLIFIPFIGAWLAAQALDSWRRPELTAKQRGVALVSASTVLGALVTAVLLAQGDSWTAHQDTAVVTLWRAGALLGLATLLLWFLPRWPRRLTPLLMLLIWADLLSWGLNFNPISSTEHLYPPSELTNYLQQDPSLFRVVPLQQNPLILGPNIPSVYGLADITGYSSLILADHVAYLHAMDSDIAVDWMAANENIQVMSHAHPLLGLLNVKYVLSMQELPQFGDWLVKQGVFNQVIVYENQRALPRAFMVHHTTIVPPEEMMPLLQNPGFRWEETALLETPLPPDQQAALAADPLASQSQVNVTAYTPNRVALSVDNPRAGLLVLSDAHYPGWEATVNGQTAQIHKVNNLVRGVYLPAGQHEIVFSFRPRPFYGGLFALLVALLTAGLVWVFAPQRGKG